jgi:ATP-dependent protease ClpP protease subunit
MEECDHYLLFRTTTPGTLELRLNGGVGWSFDGRDVQAAIDEAVRLGAEVLEVSIHTLGGGVFPGWNIKAALEKCPIFTRGCNDGVVASMGTIILLSCKEVVARRSSLFMIHEASSYSAGTARQLRGDATMLDKVNKLLLDTYVKRSGKPAAQLAKMMADETWLTPDECLALGLIDSIVEGGDPTVVDQYLPMDAKAVNAALVGMVHGGGNAPKNKVIPKNSNDMALPKGVAAALNLHEGVDDATAEAAVQRIVSENGRLTKANKTLTGELADLRAAHEANQLAGLNAMIDTALAEGRIVATDREKYLNLGKIDADVLRDTLALRPKVSDLLNVKPSADLGATAGRETWNLVAWMKADPKGLENIRKTQPAVYAEIVSRK